MQFNTYPSPPCLKAFVRYFWSYECRDACNASMAVKTMVDDSSGILFTWGEATTRNGLLLPNAIIHGQTTFPTQTVLTGKFTVIGVLFYPDALHRLFGVPAQYLKNEILALSEIARFPDANKLYDARSTAEKLQLMTHWIFKLTLTAKPKDFLLETALQEIYKNNEKQQLHHLYKSMNFTPRHAERRFKNTIGVSARHLSKVLRFQKAVQLIRQGSYKSLTDIAYQLGYFDQAHFNRHIKELSGFTPTQLADSLDVEVANLVI